MFLVFVSLSLEFVFVFVLPYVYFAVLSFLCLFHVFLCSEKLLFASLFPYPIPLCFAPPLVMTCLLSCLVFLCLVLSCLILSCRVVSCRVVSLSCLVLSFPCPRPCRLPLSCLRLVLIFFILSLFCHLLVLPCLVFVLAAFGLSLSFRLSLSCHVFSCLVLPCPVLPWLDWSCLALSAIPFQANLTNKEMDTVP